MNMLGRFKSFAFALFYLVGIVVGVSVFCGVVLFGSGYLAEFYCENNPSLILEDVCHSPKLRCEFECRSYNLNFTGDIDGCACECSDGSKVSVCSGFRYEVK